MTTTTTTVGRIGSTRRDKVGRAAGRGAADVGGWEVSKRRERVGGVGVRTQAIIISHVQRQQQQQQRPNWTHLRASSKRRIYLDKQDTDTRRRRRVLGGLTTTSVDV